MEISDKVKEHPLFKFAKQEAMHLPYDDVVKRINNYVEKRGRLRTFYEKHFGEHPTIQAYRLELHSRRNPPSLIF